MNFYNDVMTRAAAIKNVCCIYSFLFWFLIFKEVVLECIKNLVKNIMKNELQAVQKKIFSILTNSTMTLLSWKWVREGEWLWITLIIYELFPWLSTMCIHCCLFGWKLKTYFLIKGCEFLITKILKILWFWLLNLINFKSYFYISCLIFLIILKCSFPLFPEILLNFWPLNDSVFLHLIIPIMH